VPDDRDPDLDPNVDLHPNLELQADQPDQPDHELDGELDGESGHERDREHNPEPNPVADRDELVARILGPLARRHSTATVLFHHAMAERLGLGPSDHKCLDLLLERGPMTGSQLATITGMTTGAITGVVSRLERAGYLRREQDPKDGRKQRLIPSPEGLREVGRAFDGVRPASASLLDDFDAEQLAVIARFLERFTAFAYDRTAELRASVLRGGG
jgi:DNA-binding MarR family transcriptional regulator